MKRTKSEIVFEVFNIILMLCICVIMLAPYLNQIAISFNDGLDTSLGGLTVYPRKFTLTNYKAIFNNENILRSFILTVVTAGLHTFLALAVTIAAAYALNRKELPFRKGMLLFLMIPMYVSGGVIPNFILFRYLKLLDNPLIYVLLGMFSFYNMVIIRSFIQGLPSSLEESAKLDGASEVTILIRIILPLCMPVVATVALWLVVGRWNDFTTTLLYVTNQKYYTLQYVVMQIVKQSEITAKLAAEMAMTGGDASSVRNNVTSQSVQSAAVVFSTIPIIMVYPFLQKYFVKGVTIGSVKE